MRLRNVSALGLVLAALACYGSAQARVYVPGVKIVFEVRTPQGDLRSYQRPGRPPTYWEQNYPARRGDRVGVDALVATGGAELEQVRVTLDGKEIAVLTKAPWRTEVNTADLAVGDHPLEVRAKTASPHGRATTAHGTLVLVAADERAALLPAAQASDTDRERLSAVIGCLTPDLDRALDDGAAATLAKPQLFFPSAGPAAKEFFYTVSREGRVVYTSPLLPIVTYVGLEPTVEKVSGEAATKPVASVEEETASPLWLAPGEVVLTMQVGDGAGHFGPPVGVTLQIAAEETQP